MAKEQLDYDINADISKSLEQASEYEAVLNRISTQWDKVNQKANESGGTVTYRQALEGHSLNSQATSLSRDLETAIQRMSKQLLEVKHHGSDEDYTKLADTLQQLTSVLSVNQDRSGISTFGSGEAAETKLERFLRTKERAGSITGVPTGVRRGATVDEQVKLKEQQQNISAITAQYKKAVTAIEANQRKLQRNYNTSSSTGQMSYSGNKRFYENSQLNEQLTLKTSKDININSLGWEKQVSNLTNQRDTLQEKQRSGSNSIEQVSAYQKQIAQLNSQINVYNENIRLLRSLNNRLNNVSQDQTKNNYENSVKSGEIHVQRDPDSFLGFLSNRRKAIGGLVASSVINSYTNSADSGTALRKDSYNTYGDAYTAQGQTNQFDIDSFRSIQRGTQRGFSGKESAQFLDTYTSYRGTKGAVRGASYLENLARYGGVGSNTANQLGRTLEQQGAVTGSKDIKNIAEAFTGSLKESGLSGQAKVQGQALNSILSNLSGQRVTAGEAAGAGNLLNRLGQDPRFRGAAGANAINGLQNTFSNGMNSRLLTTAYTNGNAKYMGARGRAKLQESMSNVLAHPRDTQNALRYILKTSPNKDIQIAAARLSTESGGQLSVAQAKKWLSLAKSGDLVRVMRKDNRAKGRKQLRESQNSFKNSGISSVLQQQGYEDQGNYAASQSLDEIRQTTNPLKGHPVLSALTSGAGSLIQQSIGIGLGVGGFPVLMRGLEGFFGKGAGTTIGAAALSAAGTPEATAVGAAGAAGAAGTTGAASAGAASGLLGGLSLSSLAAPVAGVAGGIGAVKALGDITSGNNQRQNVGMGTLGLIGGGATAGALIGGVPGALIGAGIGTIGSMVPNFSKRIGQKTRGIWNGITAPLRPTRAKADTLRGSNANTARQSSWVKGNQGIITGYSKVLERMIKAADILKKALSTPVGSGDKEDTGGDEDVTGGDMEANAKAINNYIKKHVKGSTPEARAALLGNLQRESGLDPKAVESGGGGHGLAQWTGARFTNLQNFAKSKGKSWDDLGAQLDYMLNGDGSDSDTIKRLLQSKGSVGSLTSQIESQWERAGVAALGQRQGYAQSWYNKLPKHALGTVVSKPEVSVIGDRGAEAVVPLENKLQGQAILGQAAGFLGMKVLDSNATAPTVQREITLAPSFNINVKSNGDETLEELQKIGSQATDTIMQLLQSKLGYYSNEIVRG